MSIITTESLTTKMRPRVLEDLYGQDHIVAKFRGMLKMKRMPSVILISGKSGCGKTTLAKMINTYINCETNDACGECASCRSVKHPDFIEYNIGNTRGIDDVRQIVQGSTAMPRYAKRVILLDECHMLTSQAANCLLVPLEKPSSNTVWILSTTEPEKILPTILGRCHRFDIRPIDAESMGRRLFKIAKSEGVNLKEINGGIKALNFLISLSNGQMRDAIQMLEGLIFAISSGDQIDAKTMLQKYVADYSVEIEHASASVLHGLLSGNTKRVISGVLSVSDSRQMLYKLRWLIQYLLAEYAEIEQYKPYTFFKFIEIKKKNEIKISHVDLLLLQSLLVKAEITMNSGVDPQVVLISAFGDYLKGHESD